MRGTRHVRGLAAGRCGRAPLMTLGRLPLVTATSWVPTLLNALFALPRGGIAGPRGGRREGHSVLVHAGTPSSRHMYRRIGQEIVDDAKLLTDATGRGEMR